MYYYLLLYIVTYLLLFLQSVVEIEVEALKSLKKEICQKIKEYLLLEPRSCTPVEAKKFIKYFHNCPVSKTIYKMQ